MHRLKLDRERQTDRWTNFDRRVSTVPNSPERGFELALYSVVAEDKEACRAAVRWGISHTSEIRQRAVIANWCQAGESDAERSQLLATPSKMPAQSSIETARDALFTQVVLGKASRESARQQWSQLLPAIQQDPRSCLPNLYALFEFVDVVDKNFRLDLRQDDAHLFANLPSLFLMAMSPRSTETPDWRTRAAGLMMVTVDPNLQSSSFVQGWAMEDPKMATDGPGVAYEFLWANPYLPGLGYHNMNLWYYDEPSGLLIARDSWDTDSCWVSLYHGRVERTQCSARVFDERTTFGNLVLLPFKGDCVTVTQQRTGSTILTGLVPGSTIEWTDQDSQHTAQADRSGLLLVSATISGQVCRADRVAKKESSSGKH
jgi:hypothetical protein